MKSVRAKLDVSVFSSFSSVMTQERRGGEKVGKNRDRKES